MKTSPTLPHDHSWQSKHLVAALARLGIPDVVLSNDRTNPFLYEGRWDRLRFYFSRRPALRLTPEAPTYCLLGMDHYNDQLADAFATLLDQQPDFRYRVEGFDVVEWTRRDLYETIATALQQDPLVQHLQTLREN